MVIVGMPVINQHCVPVLQVHWCSCVKSFHMGSCHDVCAEDCVSMSIYLGLVMKVEVASRCHLFLSVAIHVASSLRCDENMSSC